MTEATHVLWDKDGPHPYRELPRDKRDVGVAYLLLIFLGLFGAHRFYAGRQSTAIAQLVLTLCIVGLPVTIVWAIVDLFLLAGHVREYNDQVPRH